jgi:hypothetical protein
MTSGHYSASRDSWLWTCAGCGKEIETNDFICPLDGLDCCSAECDQLVEERIDTFEPPGDDEVYGNGSRVCGCCGVGLCICRPLTEEDCPF